MMCGCLVLMGDKTSIRIWSWRSSWVLSAIPICWSIFCVALLWKTFTLSPSLPMSNIFYNYTTDPGRTRTIPSTIQSIPTLIAQLDSRELNMQSKCAGDKVRKEERSNEPPGRTPVPRRMSSVIPPPPLSPHDHHPIPQEPPSGSKGVRLGWGQEDVLPLE